MNRVSKAIVSATVDGASHPAFTADTASAAHPQRFAVGGHPDRRPHAPRGPAADVPVQAPGAMTATADSLQVPMAVPRLFTRFCMALPARHIVLGADRYAPADGGAETCGQLVFRSESTALEARTLSAPANLAFTAADRRLIRDQHHRRRGHRRGGRGQATDRSTFRATMLPLSVTVGTTASTPASQGAGTYAVTLGTTRPAR